MFFDGLRRNLSGFNPLLILRILLFFDKMFFGNPIVCNQSIQSGQIIKLSLLIQVLARGFITHHFFKKYLGWDHV